MGRQKNKKLHILKMLTSKAGIRNIYEVTYPTPVTLEETAMGSGVKIKIKKESVPPPPQKKREKNTQTIPTIDKNTFSG